MTSMKGTFGERARLSSIPLAVAYGAVPLGAAAARLMGGSATVSTSMPWLLLAGIGAILAMHRPTPGAPSTKGFFFKATLFMLLVVGLVMYAPDIIGAQITLLPYFRESTPLLFLLFCGLWASTCGLPDRGDFQRFGALLGVLCLIDLVTEVTVYQAVPTIRWIGNADMLAGLLLVSVCAGLKPGGNDGGAHEPDQGRTVWRVLTLLGLMACLSRTGLFAAAWVVLCFGRGLFRYRALSSLLCIGLLALTFFLPPTTSDAVRYTDYWLWVEALRLYAEAPAILLTGFPIDVPLPVQFPAGMAPIWELATGTPSSFGAFLTQVPSFWLRLTMAWGMAAPMLLLVVLFILLFRRLTRMGAGLTAALFAQGMSTPLLYDPTMAVAIGLGFILALAKPAVRPNVKKNEPKEPAMESEAAPESDPTPDPEPNPVDEWNLKPL
ncbi:hypothetical protein OAN24_06280 [Pseudodesulfovibrio sp.]|nr:hypothetical protein [Pseudodesulfovibrio sp.]